MATEKIPLIVDPDTGKIRRMQAGEVLPVNNGGTGVASVSDFKTAMQLDRVENKTGADILSGLTSQNVTTALGFTPTASAGVSVEVAGQVFANVPPTLQWLPHSTNPLGSQIGGISSYGGSTGANSAFSSGDNLGLPYHTFTMTATDTYSAYGYGSDAGYRVANPYGTLAEFMVTVQNKAQVSTMCYNIGLSESLSYAIVPTAAQMGTGCVLAYQNNNGVDYLSLYFSDGTNLYVYPCAPVIAQTTYYLRLYIFNGKVYFTIKGIANATGVVTTYVDNQVVTVAYLTNKLLRCWCVAIPTVAAAGQTFLVRFISLKILIPFTAAGQTVTSILGTGATQAPSGAVLVTVDFGTGNSAVTVTVPDSRATVGGLFICSPQPDSDEYELEPLLPQAFCKVNGQVTINVVSLSGLAHGLKRIAYFKG